MAWRDQFSDTGRFRTAAFVVKSHTTEGGRRLQRNEYPFRDTPSVQDLGRKARTCNLDLYVIGDDYLIAAKALEVALQAAGAGELVHPWLGTLRVHAETFRREDSTQFGGMAKFTVSFVEGGEVVEPSAVQDTRVATQRGADAAATSTSAQLASQHQPTGRPQSYFSRLSENISSVTGKLRGNWSNLLTSIRDSVDLAERAFGEGEAFMAQAHSGFGLAALIDRVRAAGDLITGDVATTPTSRALARSQTAIARTIRIGLITAAARQAATVSYTSQAEARAVRTAFVALVSAEIDRVDSESNPMAGDLYASVIDLRTAVVRDVDARGMRLPEITTYTPAATTPALLLAHRLYGDATRADEIVTRNAIRDPGMVPGGQPLEVLAR